MQRDFDTISRRVSRFVAHEAQIVAFNLKKPAVKQKIKWATVAFIIVNLILVSISAIFVASPKKAQATSLPTYGIQTGYYTGNGNAESITGLGFAPEVVILKSDTNATVTLMKTTSMPQNTVAYLGSATADSTTGLIDLNSNGFKVTGVANTAMVTYNWVAYRGSNCTGAGQMCVGTYTSIGANQNISTGFQPDFVMVKRTTAVAANWTSSAMTPGYTNFFMATAQDTTGTAYYPNPTFGSNYFTVTGTSSGNAVSGGIYYFVAFKNVAGSVKVGTYTAAGSPVDNTNITGVGMVPNYMFVKSAAAVSGVSNLTDENGDNSSYFSATANLSNSIQALQSDGFQIGTDTTVNTASTVYYYVCFAGAAAHTSSGTFKMASGTYTGNGQITSVSGLGFSPDLVIIHGNTATAGVFRTSMMAGDSTAYLDSATTNLAGAITELNGDGFSVGTSATVNTSGTAYYWTAYGNAWDPEQNSGASDFYVGAYYTPGTSVDNRNIVRLPFQADMVTVKPVAAVAGTYRTSAMGSSATDISGYFAASAETTNLIQTFNADGFQVGTATNVQSLSTVHFYFGFKVGTNFSVGTYTGTTAAQNVTSATFQPDNLWVKAATAVRGVEKTGTMAAANCEPFINVADVTTDFTGMLSNGFALVGAAADTNVNGTTFRYVAWHATNTVSTPTYAVQTGYFTGNGNALDVTGLGFAPEAIILKSDTAATVTLLKTATMPQNTVAYMGSATADSTAGLIDLETNGFRVTGVANTALVTYNWVAYKGSNCTSGGTMCIGTYTSAGSAANITTGFQPNFVMVKRTTAVAANWTSSSMTGGYTNFFMATAQDTTGTAYYPTTPFGATYFSVTGTSTGNAVSGGIYYYVAFKNVAGTVQTGTYTASSSPVDNTNITGVGMVPNYMFVKSAAAVSAVSNLTDENGDNSSYFTATADLSNSIQALQSDGFQIGTDTTVNTASTVYYYVAFAGAAAHSSSGTFKMASGTYSGNGQINQFSGLGFTPDLVIIKGNTASAGVFRTAMMSGDSTAYLDAATANLAGAITSLNGAGFSVGTNAVTNTAGTQYYWTAYGNAWHPETNSGAADFYIGAYYTPGTSVNSRAIVRLPFQANMVTVKPSAAVAGVYRTSDMASGASTGGAGFFAATAENATGTSFQTLDANGFTIGTSTNVQNLTTVHWYFGFKTGTNFAVGTYSGNGGTQTISTPAFQPNNLWIKATGATRGVEKTDKMIADSAVPFINVANLTGAVTSLATTGFNLGAAAETNSSGSSNYRFVAWRVPAGTINISGNIYTAAAGETTLDTTAYTINISVNNAAPVSTTAVGGYYAAANVSANSGDSIAVYIYNNANDANAFTVANGSTDITGLNLIVGKVTVGNNDANTTTNANICNQSTYPATSPADRLITCSGNNITANSGVEWHVLSGSAYDTGASATLTTQGTGGGLHVDANAVATTSSTTTIADFVTITAGSILNGGAGIGLNVGGTWTNNGTFNQSTSTVTLNGTSQTIAGSTATTFYNLSTSGSSNATNSVAVTVGNNLVVGDGTTLTAAGYNFTVTGTTNIGTGTSGNLTISSATGTKTFTGLITVATNGTWANTSANSAVTLAGGITNNGTFNAGTGVYTFQTNAQNIGGTVAIPNATITGVTVTNNGTFTVSTALSGTGGVTQAASVSSILNIGGTSGITTITAANTGNTVNYTGAAQTIHSNTYYNLTLNGSGTDVMTAGVTAIGGNFVLSGSVSTANVAALAITGNLNVGDGTTFSPGAYNLSVGATTNIGGGTSGNLTITSATGTKTFTGLITVAANGNWTNTAANSPITCAGGITNNGTFNSGSGLYTFQTNAQNLNGTLSIPNVTITAVTVTNYGTFTVGTSLAGTGGLTQNTSATLNIGGTSGITTITATANYNTVNYTSAAQTIHSNNYYNLTLSGSGTDVLPVGMTTIGTNGVGGNLVISGTVATTTVVGLTIYGNLSTGDGTSFTVAGFALTVTGTTTVGGGTSGSLIISSSTGTKNFSGLTTISAGATWNNSGNSGVNFDSGLTNNGSTFTAGSGVYLFDTNASQAIGGASAISMPNVTVNTPTVLTNNSTVGLTIGTALTGTGTLTQGTNAILNIGGTTLTLTLTATASPNTVTYNSGSAQTVYSASYYNLNIGGAATTATYTAGGDLTVGGVLTIVSSSGTNTFDASNKNINLTGTGTSFVISASEVFTPSSSTVNYQGNTTATNITATTYYILNVGGAATTNTYNLAGAITVNYVLTIVTSSGTNTLNAASYAINLAGNATPFVIGSGEIFTPGTGTVNYVPSGTTGVTVAPTSYKNVTFNKASNTFSLGGPFDTGTVDGNITITAGILDVTSNNYAISCSGTWSNSGTFNPRGGTVTFNDTTTNENISGNLTTGTNGGYPGFYNVTFSDTNSVLTTFQAAADIGNNFTINTGVPVTAPAANLNVAGNFSNSGTFTNNSGTVTLNGAGGTTQIVSGATTFNNLTATATSARTINFDSGVTTTVSGTWTVTGATGQYITLGRNGGTGTNQWSINPTAKSVDYVTPSNSNNLSGTPINPTHYTDGGNNTNWFNSNNMPQTPTSLTQGKTSGANNIAESAWTNGNQPWFGFVVTDPDADPVRYQIQVDNTDSSFTHVVLDYTVTTPQSSGSTFAYQVGQSGGTYAVGSTSMTLSDSATGYWWRVYGIDSSNSYSVTPAYFGTQATVDVKVDATAPTGGTIYDGNDGSQHNYNDYVAGSLTQLSAYWTATAPSFTVSGAAAAPYQYAIGTTQGGTNVLTWTATDGSGTQTYANATGLNLQTGVKYYFSVKATDAAGNVETINSSGQQVYPTLSYSISTNNINFAALSNANSWTDSQSVSCTVSTNASAGYVITGWINDYLRAIAYPSDTINDFAGTWASPAAWPGGTYGFGYTSNDTLVQGSNRFNSGASFAAYQHSAPGDIVADHTAAVNGSTGAVSNETFTVTNKVSVANTQTAATYQTTLMLIVSANY